MKGRQVRSLRDDECEMVEWTRYSPRTEYANSFVAMPTKEMVLLLGGNMGDPTLELEKAEAEIANEFGGVISRSRDHWTEPWGFSDPRLFLNRAILVRTQKTSEQVLQELLRIERRLGRERIGTGGLGPRNIDIDILAAEDEIMDTPTLVLPHPRMHMRRFALAPTADICPDWVHPVLHRTALQLLNALPIQ